MQRVVEVALKSESSNNIWQHSVRSRSLIRLGLPDVPRRDLPVRHVYGALAKRQDRDALPLSGLKS